ncbi:MAG: hypothetical protein O2962_05610 [Cyanobacteria bacterium]|nr:hypothetical protein [Cyanobacteriota bacterium]
MVALIALSTLRGDSLDQVVAPEAVHRAVDSRLHRTKPEFVAVINKGLRLFNDWQAGAVTKQPESTDFLSSCVVGLCNGSNELIHQSKCLLAAQVLLSDALNKFNDLPVKERVEFLTFVRDDLGSDYTDKEKRYIEFNLDNLIQITKQRSLQLADLGPFKQLSFDHVPSFVASANACYQPRNRWSGPRQEFPYVMAQR